jgi:hypothetical protein
MRGKNFYEHTPGYVTCYARSLDILLHFCVASLWCLRAYTVDTLRGFKFLVMLGAGGKALVLVCAPL